MTFWLIITAAFVADVALVWWFARNDRRVARAQAHRHFFDVLIDDGYIGTAASSTSVAVPTPPIVTDVDDGPVLVNSARLQGIRQPEGEDRTFLESVS